jgi:hypothetical protein
MTFLALEVKQRGRSESQVLLTKREDFRDAGAGIIERQQQGVIALSDPCLGIRGCHNRVDFRPRQIADQATVRAFGGNRQYLRRQIDARRFTERHQPKKGTNCGQPRVPSLNAITTVSFDAVEEPHDRLCLQVVQG